MMRVIEIYISKTSSMERFFDEKVFLKDIVISGSTEDPPLKNYNFGEIIFFTDFFSLKQNWFVWSQSLMGYTNLML